MFRNIGISLRFVIATVVAVIGVLFATQFTTFSYMKDMLNTAEEYEMEKIYQNVVSSVESEGRLARAMSALVAGIPQVQEAFAERDRETLESYFLPGFGKLKSEYGVRQFQFHEPPATSFLRIHKPAKFGDDLSSFRFTVIETNRSRVPIQGLEVGVAGLGVRGLVPVSHAGNHQGSVEFGMSFGQAFFDDYAKQHDVDLELYIRRDSGMELFASTMEGNGLISMESLKGIDEDKSLYDQGELNGTSVSLYAATITNYSGKPIGVLVLAKDRSYFASASSTLSALVLGLSLLSVLVIGSLVWLISRGVVKPLAEAAQAMESIASEEGNLSERLDESGNDEVTQIARAYNQFAGKTESLVDRASEMAGILSEQVAEFAAMAAHTHSEVSKQHEQTTQVATAMTEMSATVHEVAQNSTHAAEAAVNADAQANDGRQVVEGAVASIQSLASEVGQAGKMVQQVESDSERIGSVLDVIRGIADQTNLLALNAAIEAARAGEQGRGFAVVADEVRTLARRTQDSTEEIQEMIESLQSGVQKTVEVMEAGQQQASDSVDQSQQVNQSLEEITQAVDTISQMSAQIATAAEQQSAVAEDINRNITEISHGADGTAADAEKSAQSSEEMAMGIEQLVAQLSQFNTKNRHVRELQRAKVAHLTWTSKVRSFLDGKSSLDSKVAFSHTQCSLGKWLESVGREAFSHLPEVSQLDKPHRELHETIKHIADLKQRGDMEAAEREYEKIEPLSHRIVDLLSAMKDKIG
jgi:methyl-accepting chemotaxis protein